MSIEQTIRNYAAQRDHQTTHSALTAAIGQRDALLNFVESIVRDLKQFHKDDLTTFEDSLLFRATNIINASNLNTVDSDTATH